MGSLASVGVISPLRLRLPPDSRRERAEAFLIEVERDEPETAALLRVEPVALAEKVLQKRGGTAANNGPPRGIGRGRTLRCKHPATSRPFA
jgi:hypothetical protein